MKGGVWNVSVWSVIFLKGATHFMDRAFFISIGLILFP